MRKWPLILFFTIEWGCCQLSNITVFSKTQQRTLYGSTDASHLKSHKSFDFVDYWIPVITIGVISLFLVPTLTFLTVFRYCRVRFLRYVPMKSIQQSTEKFLSIGIEMKPLKYDIIGSKKYVHQVGTTREGVLGEGFRIDLLKKGNFVLGGGVYGIVYRATYNGQPAAIKKPLNTDLQVLCEALIEELNIMAGVFGDHRHLNILQVYGGVLGNESDRSDLCMVMELCENTLEEELKKYDASNFSNEFEKIRQSQEDGYTVVVERYFAEITSTTRSQQPDFCYTTSNLHSYALQIALGMEFLNKIASIHNWKFCHRDLAARNVLLKQIGTVKCAKVADFGLARKYDEDYYFQQTQNREPFKWMSPEALLRHRFSIKSDVWSYGILLHELFTFGKTPHDGRSLDEVKRVLESEEGIQISSIPTCPEEIQALMFECWKLDPEERQEFSGCVNLLREHLRRANPQLLKDLEITQQSHSRTTKTKKQ